MHHRNCPIAVDPRNECCDCAALIAADAKFLQHPLRFLPTFFKKVGRFSGAGSTRFSAEKLEGLETFTSGDLGIKSPLDNWDANEAMPMVFILEHKGKEYLVNTEGYAYCRYITRIVRI